MSSSKCETYSNDRRTKWTTQSPYVGHHRNCFSAKKSRCVSENCTFECMDVLGYVYTFHVLANVCMYLCVYTYVFTCLLVGMCKYAYMFEYNQVNFDCSWWGTCNHNTQQWHLQGVEKLSFQDSLCDMCHQTQFSHAHSRGRKALNISGATIGSFSPSGLTAILGPWYYVRVRMCPMISPLISS